MKDRSHELTFGTYVELVTMEKRKKKKLDSK